MNPCGYIKLVLLYVIFFLTSMSALAFDQPVDDAHPFGLSYDDETELKVHDGQPSWDFIFNIPEGSYLYREKMRVVPDEKSILVTLDLPAGTKKYDEVLEQEVEAYYHEAVVTAQFDFSKLKIGPKEIKGTIYYQGCSGNLCYPIANHAFTLKIAQGSFIPVTDFAAQRASEMGFLDYLDVNNFEVILKKGFFFALVLFFLAGLVTGFTPCVLPVIPLTLTFMGVSARQKRSENLKSLLIFVLGLVLMYTVLAMLSALLGKALGFWFQSLTFQIGIAVFFLAMALWMFGILQFNLPPSLQNKIVQIQPKGHLKQLYAGLTIGFLAAPCVGPLLGILLLYISTTQDMILGSTLMLSYALGLSILFFVLGFFSQSWVRHFGHKSDLIKKILGFLLLGTALFYLYGIVKPFLSSKDSFFQPSLEQGVILAKQSHKKILVDFSAEWCVPCQKWNLKVWQNSKVQERVNQNFIPIKIDCTHNTKSCESALDAFKVQGMPTILFLDLEQNEIPGSRLMGVVMTETEFMAHLNKVHPIPLSE